MQKVREEHLLVLWQWVVFHTTYNTSTRRSADGTRRAENMLPNSVIDDTTLAILISVQTDYVLQVIGEPEAR